MKTHVNKIIIETEVFNAMKYKQLKNSLEKKNYIYKKDGCIIAIILLSRKCLKMSQNNMIFLYSYKISENLEWGVF